MHTYFRQTTKLEGPILAFKMPKQYFHACSNYCGKEVDGHEVKLHRSLAWKADKSVEKLNRICWLTQHACFFYLPWKPFAPILSLTPQVLFELTLSEIKSYFSAIFLFFFYFFYFLIFPTVFVPMGLLPWEIQDAFPGESQLQESHTTQPTVHAECFSVSLNHHTLTWTRGSLTCAQM